MLHFPTTINLWILILMLVWVLPWKGYALWRAAKNSDRNWFILLFLVNALAILDIIYIFAIDKKRNQKIKEQAKDKLEN